MRLKNKLLKNRISKFFSSSFLPKLSKKFNYMIFSIIIRIKYLKNYFLFFYCFICILNLLFGDPVQYYLDGLEFYNHIVPQQDAINIEVDDSSSDEEEMPPLVNIREVARTRQSMEQHQAEENAFANFRALFGNLEENSESSATTDQSNSTNLSSDSTTKKDTTSSDSKKK